MVVCPEEFVEERHLGKKVKVSIHAMNTSSYFCIINIGLVLNFARLWNGEQYYNYSTSMIYLLNK